MASKVQFTVQFNNTRGQPEVSTFTATHCGGVRAAEWCARSCAEAVRRASGVQVEVYRRADGYSEGSLILNLPAASV